MGGHHLSPECDLPFAPSLLRPAMLLWPAMLSTPVREVRAVLAFVATVFARANLQLARALSCLKCMKHACLCIYSASCNPTSHQCIMQCAASEVWRHTDLALALCMPRRKPPI